MRVEHKDEISVAEFAQTYLHGNQPVVLGSSFTKHWRARREWVERDGKPNFARLRELYGTATVQVADCDTPYFNDQKRTEMPMAEFLDSWQSASGGKLYCKDFHLAQHGAGYRAYEVPQALSDDWLNMASDITATDDYRFCYMGGNGTWTPFHRDVFCSYSWSANICGTKRWILIPPGQDHLFSDGLGQTVYSLQEGAHDAKRFPRLDELQTVEIVQQPGEIVFVPSGWWHQVHNEGDTISINHNWANEYNLAALYSQLRREVADVRHAFRDLADVDEFHDIVQRALLANAGMDYRWFVGFLETIARVYLDAQPGGGGDSPLGGIDPFFSSPQSIRFALGRVSATLDRLLNDDVTGTVDGLPKQIAALHARVGPVAIDTRGR
ncbi:hypothetical protein EV175_003538 [Coemansia sp. RSA 1933]|nr:hypothetical protein EV175_003538 [Coemansia sp. RSA 1933]